ncbi:MAG: HNH endonuclease, partial [Gammaproteobacteria bacterium]|nr:HNH endonuclease [Gammaproteobacteria bacterium]
WENVVTACKDCNIAKADKSLDPSPVAIKPSYKALLKGQNSQIEYKDDMWREYIVA